MTDSRLPKRLRTRVADERRTEPTTPPETPACLCSHMWVWHLAFNGTAGKCDVAACGCSTYRADDGQWPPARLRETYDPSPEPIDRKPR